MKLLIGVVAVLAVAGGMLMLAIRNNGPAVLDAIDRLTGGTRGVVLVAKTSYGGHQDQKLRIYALFKAAQLVKEAAQPGEKVAVMWKAVRTFLIWSLVRLSIQRILATPWLELLLQMWAILLRCHRRLKL